MDQAQEIAMKVINFLLTYLGGGAVIIGGIAIWLGKVWAERILEKEKKSLAKLQSEYTTELEKYKNELSLLKTKIEKYESKHFECFNTIWRELFEIKNLLFGYTLTEKESIKQKLTNGIFSLDNSIKINMLYLTNDDIDLLNECINLITVNMYSLDILSRDDVLERLSESAFKQIRENCENYHQQINAVTEKLRRSFVRQFSV